MKYKEFKKWYNKNYIKTSDWLSNIDLDIYCVGVMVEIDSLPFWKREKIWKNKYETIIVRDIVNKKNTYIKKRK